MKVLVFKHGLYAKRNDIQNKNCQFADVKIISNTLGISYTTNI